MNVPMDNAFFQLLYHLINTPGFGSAVVWLVILSALATYASLLRHIHAARDPNIVDRGNR